MAPFTLSRATPEDMPRIVEVQYQDFTAAFVRELFMGCRSTSDLPKLASKYAEDMARNPTDVWIKMTSSITGEIVAASNWKLYLGFGMMMRWGCDLADLLFLPSWIEASPEGNFQLIL